MTSREWLNCCDNDDPWEAYPNYYTDCDDELDECDDGACGNCTCKNKPTSKCQVKDVAKENICPDCEQEGVIDRTACICVNKNCTRHTIWGC